MLTANHIQILQHIRISSEITCADSSQPAIVRWVGDLRSQGWMVDNRTGEHNSRGRAIAVLHINPEAGYTLGLEFGREHLIMCAVDANGRGNTLARASGSSAICSRQHNLIYLFIGGLGIGPGIFVNNVLLRRSLGVCGEIGHVIVEEDGRSCQCGNRGCLETVAAHQAGVSRLRHRLEKGVMSQLDTMN